MPADGGLLLGQTLIYVFWVQARMVSRNAKIPRARRGPNESLMSVGWAARIPLAPSLPRPRPYSVTVGIRGSSSSFQVDLVVNMVIIIPFAFLSSRRYLRFFNRRVVAFDKMSFERGKHLALDAPFPPMREEYGWGKRTRKGDQNERGIGSPCPFKCPFPFLGRPSPLSLLVTVA